MDGVDPGDLLTRRLPRAAVVPSQQLRHIVVVLGMHRSGTSLCSHILSALGVDMADRAPGRGLESPGEDNAKGHWERWEIVEFHDRILKMFDQEFYSPLHDFALPVAWWADPQVAQVRRELAGFLEGRMGSGMFGFKDPRTIRLMPMWHQVFNELKLVPKIIYCVRNPAQVARSLRARDRIPLDIGEYRWLCYNLEFFRYTKSLEFCTIEYETWFNEPEQNLARLTNFLDLPSCELDPDFDLTLSGIVESELRHDDPVLFAARQPLIRSTYQLARYADRDSATREQICHVATQFHAFQQLQTTFREQLGDFRTKLGAFEAQLSGAHADLSAEREQLSTARAAFSVARAELSETNARLEVTLNKLSTSEDARLRAEAALIAWEARAQVEQAHRDRLEREINDFRVHHQRLQLDIARLRAIEGSTTWRLTAPLRVVAGGVLRLLRNGLRSPSDPDKAPPSSK
jgi:hypothetical protein